MLSGASSSPLSLCLLACYTSFLRFCDWVFRRSCTDCCFSHSRAAAMKRGIFFALSVVLLVAVASASVSEVLEKNGLPTGLLPTDVKNYSLSKDGKFVVELNKTCYITIDDEVVYYSKNISGELSYGKIGSLSGIQTQQLFVWLPVTGFYVDDPPTPYIYFQVGVLTKRLAKATFESEPKCRSHAFKEQLHGFHLPAWAVKVDFVSSFPRKALQWMHG